MFRRSVTLALLAISVLPTAASAATQLSVPAATAPAVAVPPDLQSLEQRLGALRLTSERFSTTVSVAQTPSVKGPVGPFEHIFGRASSAVTTLFTSSGEVSFAPVQASLQVNFSDLDLNARLIGSTLYVEEPYLAKIDAGHRWVEQHDKSLTETLGLQRTELGSFGGEPGQESQRLTELVAHARSINELGLANVDGQPVTRFKLAAPLSVLQGPSSSNQSRFARLQRELFVAPVHVELFLAENGLPLRTSVTIGIRHHAGSLIEQSDIKAVNEPVVVQAPPASETVTTAELERVLRKHIERLREIAERRHRHKAKKK